MKQILDNQRNFFLTGKTKSIQFRLDNLNKLKASIQKHYNDLVLAFKKDYNKCEFDMLSTELVMTLNELKFMQRNLKKLSRPKMIKTSIINFPSKGFIIPEPYGVCLIVAPWNYPLQLALVPLIGAIATGNTCILKLSANTPTIASVIQDILNIFDENYVYVTKPQDRDEIFSQKYDFCFYTGSTTVGKELLKNQAEYLTPCILELGGKSPCIVDFDADLEICAKRIIWGKFLNAGQTCVAPDYVMIHQSIKEDFLKKLKIYVKKFYYKNDILNEDFTFVINDKQTHKLLNLIKDEKKVLGGTCKDRLFEPTIIEDVNFDSPIMQEEIFGPILPIIEFESIDNVIAKLKTLEKPLAFYFFGKKNSKKCINSLSFGGGAINDTIMHLTEEKLPFGGVGYSGMGAYHGKKSFEAFSHYKSVLKKGKAELNFKYPPHTKKKISLLKFLFKIKK